MGNVTQKKPITPTKVFDRLNAELDVLDGKQNKRSLLVRVVRKIESFYGDPDALKDKYQDSDENHAKRQKVYTAHHASLLNKVKKLEAKMIEDGNK